MIELAVSSNFSFLHASSHPEELVDYSAHLNHSGIGIADQNSLAGVVRAFIAAKKHKNFRYLVGCRLVFSDDTPELVVYPRQRTGYGQLCRLLSRGKMRAQQKGACQLYLEDFLPHAYQFQIIVMPKPEDYKIALEKITKAAPKQVWLGLKMTYNGLDKEQGYELEALAKQFKIACIATTDILYHQPNRRPLQDVLTAIRLHINLDQAGYNLEKNSERYLKSLEEYHHLYRHFLPAIKEQQRFIAPIDFCLDSLSYHYPNEPVPSGKTPQQHLEDLTWQGAQHHFGAKIPQKITHALQKELSLIKTLNYAHYFLTVHDIVKFAHSQNILCQGRGSAANSAVCYCLNITNVNPTEIDLLFERFISQERHEPPDIDVDFEHERREEVMQYVYQRYGRHRAAIVASVISYRIKSAMRDVGKALGLSPDITTTLVTTLAKTGKKTLNSEDIRLAGLNPHDSRIWMTLNLAHQLLGFPRHLSQHVGGFILTQDRLDETVPIGPAAMDNRTFIEWDKDDISALKLMKVDVLSLGMLTAIRKALALLKQHKNIFHTLYSLPREDPAVYAMLSRGDSVGVFQVESRAQMNMLPRLKPQSFYDLVIQVAIVRPGPIQGDMVHPYLRRRAYQEKVTYPAPSPQCGPPDELQRILGKTLGVPLFQEQAMRIAIEAAKFSPNEANMLRRAMATFRRTGTIHKLHHKMVAGMVARGYEKQFAENCFKQIEGFGEYGFPESHAASFAHLVYVSAWIKCHHPEIFAAALLNCQPMGFYAPAQIIYDARNHHVPIYPVDVNKSYHDCTLEPPPHNTAPWALRLGLRQIVGFSHHWSQTIIEERKRGNFATMDALYQRMRLPKKAYQLLADADGFQSLNMERRQALWAINALPDGAPLALFGHGEHIKEQPLCLPPMALSEHVVADYQTTKLSLKAHPMAFLREELTKHNILACKAAVELANGTKTAVAGIITIRQRPGSAKGVVFLTMEDESGIANIVVWPKIMQQFRQHIISAKAMIIYGSLQRDRSGVTHIVAHNIKNITTQLLNISQKTPLFHTPEPPLIRQHPRQFRVLPRSRDFH